MRRRTFLGASAAAAALAAAAYAGLEHLPVTVNYPGRAAGHRLRNGGVTAARSVTPQQFDVVVLGSGIAALTTVWKLTRLGVRNVALVLGPEHYGNAASASSHGIAYPTGAHYLPLPSMESLHMREMLSDFGIISADPYAERPTYDERYVLHSPGDRVLYKGSWQDGYLPIDLVPAAERDQHRRFFALMDQFSSQRGSDGRRGFAVPIELASSDEQFLALDRIDFASWIERQGLRSETLRWYLDYCCRDDYGRLAGEVSAYAGIHYFAARGGMATNAERGAVITFPAGLGVLAQRLEEGAGLKREHIFNAMATRVLAGSEGVLIDCVRLDDGANFEPMVLTCKSVVVAMPLFVASHVVEGLASFGFKAASHMPHYAPWMVSNFVLKAFPQEQPGSALSWDNVVYGARDLGYVVSTHQDIRQSRPDFTSFTAYSALAELDIEAGRRWLDQASADQLLKRASHELGEAYGWRLGPCVEQVEITVRGHAMASPSPGYRSNAGLLALRAQRGAVQFAHSDLSGYSVCEEAAWWGYRAAGRIARGI